MGMQLDKVSITFNPVEYWFETIIFLYEYDQ